MTNSDASKKNLVAGKCGHCGTYAPAASKFCGECGNPLPVSLPCSPNKASGDQCIPSPPKPAEKRQAAPIEGGESSGGDPESMEGGIFVAADGSAMSISGIRKSITEWANAIPHHDLSDLGAAVELLAVRNFPAYRIELCSLVETRMVGWTEEPHFGKPLSGRTINRPQDVNLWAISTNPPKGFEKKIKHYDIDGSAESSDCRNCSSKGTTRCGSCAGQGHIRCRSCAGKGEIRCGSCSGGQTRCGSCGGKGRTKSFVDNRMEDCSSCDGSGTKDCSCGNGFRTCGGCSGAGQNECESCGGAGESDCLNCKGAGRLVRFLQLRSTYEPKEKFCFLYSDDVPEQISAHVEALSDSGADGRISSQSPKLTNPQDIVGANHPRVLSSAQDFLKTAHVECESKSGRMVRQRLRVTRVPCHRVDYRFSGKDYVLWALGASFKIHAGISPLTDLDAEYLRRANQEFETGEAADAFRWVEKSIEMAACTADEPTKAQAEQLKSRIQSRLNQEYVRGSLIGMSVAFLSILLMGAYLKSISLSALVVTCLLGGLAGGLLSLAGASIASRRNRIRWAAVLSGGMGAVGGIATQPRLPAPKIDGYANSRGWSAEQMAVSVAQPHGASKVRDEKIEVSDGPRRMSKDGGGRVNPLAEAESAVSTALGPDALQIPDLLIPLPRDAAITLVRDVWREKWEVESTEKVGWENGFSLYETEERLIKKIGKDWRIRFSGAFVERGQQTWLLTRILCQRGSGSRWASEENACIKKHAVKFEKDIESAVSAVPDESKDGDFSGIWHSRVEFPDRRLRSVETLTVRQTGGHYESVSDVKYLDTRDGAFVSGFRGTAQGSVMGRVVQLEFKSDSIPPVRGTCELRMLLDANRARADCTAFVDATGQTYRGTTEYERSSR